MPVLLQGKLVRLQNLVYAGETLLRFVFLQRPTRFGAQQKQKPLQLGQERTSCISRVSFSDPWDHFAVGIPTILKK